MMLDDLRTIAMLDWLENDLLLTIVSSEPASSDASFRRYFRIKAIEGQFIVMDAPPEKEDIELFIRVAELLANSNVNVPTIFQQNLTEGFLLLEDFGSHCFLDQLTSETVNTLYQSAFDALFKLQSATHLLDSSLPLYNQQLLQRELGIFEEWFLGHALDIQISPSVWKTLCTILVTTALEQPIVCVHRDYHSRNLMVLTENSPGVIDFQDAVIGPITYDLVSLLRDCYIAWPDHQVDEWVAMYYQKLTQAQLINCTPTCFKYWFDLMGMQRHLKAIGIFSRLHLRDSKSNYLNDIPRTLNYISDVCANHQALFEFGDVIKNQILPALDNFISAANR